MSNYNPRFKYSQTVSCRLPEPRGVNEDGFIPWVTPDGQELFVTRDYVVNNPYWRYYFPDTGSVTNNVVTSLGGNISKTSKKGSRVTRVSKDNSSLQPATKNRKTIIYTEGPTGGSSPKDGVVMIQSGRSKFNMYEAKQEKTPNTVSFKGSGDTPISSNREGSDADCQEKSDNLCIKCVDGKLIDLNDQLGPCKGCESGSGKIFDIYSITNPCATCDPIKGIIDTCADMGPDYECDTLTGGCRLKDGASSGNNSCAGVGPCYNCVETGPNPGDVEVTPKCDRGTSCLEFGDNGFYCTCQGQCPPPTRRYDDSGCRCECRDPGCTNGQSFVFERGSSGSSGACGCYCPNYNWGGRPEYRGQSRCGKYELVNGSNCQCECVINDSKCPGNLSADLNTCTCVCDKSKVSCPDGQSPSDDCVCVDDEDDGDNTGVGYGAGLAQFHKLLP